MNIFRDTIQTAPLPVKLAIYNKETGDEFDFLVVYEVVKFIKRPAYDKRRNVVAIYNSDVNSNVTVERYGDESYSLRLSYENSSLNDKNWRLFPLPETEKMPPGYYRIERNDSADTLFEVEERFEITMSTDQFFVASIDKNSPITSFSTWLERAISDLIKLRKISLLAELKKSEWYLKRGYIFGYGYHQLKDNDIRNLIVLGSMLEAKISNGHKEVISELMRLISLLILTGVSRYRIIKELVSVRANEFVFNDCIKYYALFLFEYPIKAEKELKELVGEVKRFSSKLALLMLMKANVPIRETFGNPTYRDVIGTEGIGSMMQSNKPTEQRNEDRKHFLLEDGQSTVHIKIPEEMSGINQFYDMIDEKRTRNDRIYLDKKKIPDSGIYINGSRYTDLFVNWYIRNHPRGEAIKDELNIEMRDSFKSFLNNVYYKLNRAKKDETIGLYFKEYDEALSRRGTGNFNEFSLPNYFYFVGLAALIIQMPCPESLEEIWETANTFFITALPIAPYMTERDYLMASTFLYLRKKER